MDSILNFIFTTNFNTHDFMHENQWKIFLQSKEYLPLIFDKYVILEKTYTAVTRFTYFQEPGQF